MGQDQFLDLEQEFELGARAYLDGANHGPLPRRARLAAERALGWKCDPATLDETDYFALPDRIRALTAGLLGTEGEDVALATGASHGIGLVACGLEWQRGDHVVIPRGEFPANSLPWLMLCERGVQVQQVDPNGILEALRDTTRVVSVGHVNFATGRRLPIETIGAACEANGTLFVVDAAQSFGAVPFDVRACRAAVVAMAGYKWLMGPYGTGLTYVRPDIVERLRVPCVNWSAIEGARDFNHLVGLEPRYRRGAARFDTPETAAFIHASAMAESLSLLAEVGVDRAFAHVSALIDRIIAGLPSGYRCESPMQAARRSTIVRLVGPDVETTVKAHARLQAAGVAVSLRESGLRVAPGIWNTPAHVDRLLAVLAAV